MYCRECGTKIEGGTFCPNCGKKVIDDTSGKEEKAYSSNINRTNRLTFKERYWLEVYRDNFMLSRETIERKGIKIDENYKFDTGAKHPSKIIAEVLGTLFGNLGLHRFYLGYYLYGGLYLALTLIFAILGFDKLILAVYFLGWIDVYRIFNNKLKNVDEKELR